MLKSILSVVCTFNFFFLVFSVFIGVAGLFSNSLKDNSTLTIWLIFVYGLLILLWIIIDEIRISLLNIRIYKLVGQAGIIKYLENPLSDLKRALIAINEKDQKLAQQLLHAALQGFSAAFSNLTNEKCRTCIKSLWIDPEEPAKDYKYKTKTFIRDYQDLSTDSDTIYVPVAENTDFAILTTDRTKKYWLSNNISTHKNYKNSSLKHIKHDDWDSYFNGSDCKYRSTIIWSIANNHEPDLNRDSSDTPNNSDDDLIGFLCIDSLGTNIFDPDFAPHVGICFAEALFPVLMAFSRQFSQKMDGICQQKSTKKEKRKK